MWIMDRNFAKKDVGNPEPKQNIFHFQTRPFLHRHVDRNQATDKCPSKGLMANLVLAYHINWSARWKKRKQTIWIVIIQSAQKAYIAKNLNTLSWHFISNHLITSRFYPHYPHWHCVLIPSFVWTDPTISGWWFETLWKIWKSIGMSIPNIWKNKSHVPVTTNQILSQPVHKIHCQSSPDMCVVRAEPHGGSAHFMTFMTQPTQGWTDLTLSVA